MDGSYAIRTDSPAQLRAATGLLGQPDWVMQRLADCGTKSRPEAFDDLAEPERMNVVSGGKIGIARR